MAKTKKNKKKKNEGVMADRLQARKDEPYTNFESHEWYVGRFDGCEVKQGQYGEYLILGFTILNGELEDGKPAKGRKCNLLSDAALMPSRQLWEHVSVLIGREPDIDEEVDLTAFYGKKYKVHITNEKDKKNPDVVYSRIKKLKRYKKKSK